jgi:hypothetical protein
MGAAVGHLTRNIKIIGEDYDKLYTESYGARVLVGVVKGKKTHRGNKMLCYFVSLKSASTQKLTLKANNNIFLNFLFTLKLITHNHLYTRLLTPLPQLFET